ncbi:MAG: hypothetical protein HYX92_05115 [Chloroflexi bacterium]|nr:hypothetical protein [Chloroflexota bacterium]
MDKSKLFEIAALSDSEAADLPERQKKRLAQFREYAKKHAMDLGYLYDAAFGA